MAVLLNLVIFLQASTFAANDITTVEMKTERNERLMPSEAAFERIATDSDRKDNKCVKINWMSCGQFC